MATTYLSPGVYVEEVSGGVKPIAGVGTSTGAFVGIAEKGEIGKAKLITNWSQFVKEFGGFIPNGYLAYAVYGFFAEGGTSCYVVRTCHYTDIMTPATKSAETSAFTLVDNSDAKCIRVSALSEGVWGHNISVKTGAASEGSGFKIRVRYQGIEDDVEIFDKLTMSDVEDVINTASNFIRVEKDAWKEGSTDVTGSGNVPKNDQEGNLSGGDDGISGIVANDFIGDKSAQNGLYAFDVVDDINIVAIPDMYGDRGGILDGLNYCKNRKDCFFIADPPYGLTPTQAKDFKNATGTYSGNAFNSSYGALYYPWVYLPLLFLFEWNKLALLLCLVIQFFTRN